MNINNQQNNRSFFTMKINTTMNDHSINTRQNNHRILAMSINTTAMFCVHRQLTNIDYNYIIPRCELYNEPDAVGSLVYYLIATLNYKW
ncbi:hypothetical protein BgiBS90_003365 [Biomphalaria glabrata]|nr:hypothetical protein BgiBS90_003365 [Biomphalaria glabrata]